jgi:hypothetical protein
VTMRRGGPVRGQPLRVDRGLGHVRISRKETRRLRMRCPRLELLRKGGQARRLGCLDIIRGRLAATATRARDWRGLATAQPGPERTAEPRKA